MLEVTMRNTPQKDEDDIDVSVIVREQAGLY